MAKIVRSSGSLACLCIALTALSLLAGCDDECKRGKSECVNGTLIRTCVPSKDGDSNEWLLHECGAQATCKNMVVNSDDAGATPMGDAGMAKGTTSALTNADLEDISKSGAACIGRCLKGAITCVNDALASVCVSDGVSTLNACNVGTKCVENVGCAISDEGAVQACKPGAKACSGEKVEKVCDADGTGWTQTACLPNEVCMKDECVPDPNSSCDDTNTCIDNKTAARCLGEGKGFELVECTGDTYCEFGRCRGVGCALGETCQGFTGSGLAIIRSCDDGKNFTDSVCAANEVCKQDKDHAKCVPAECNPTPAIPLPFPSPNIVTFCGDPRDPKVDTAKNFTSCVVDTNGIPTWVSGTCDGATTCDPTKSVLYSGAPCTQACTPGAERCQNGVVNGIAQGKQVCGKDGKWGPVTSCNSGAKSELDCVALPQLDTSTLQKVACVDPICAWALSGADTSTGFCEGEKVRLCNPDGTIAKTATACEFGACAPTGAAARADGRLPGACPTVAPCQDGDSACIHDPNDGATSLFRTCKDGKYPTSYESCAKNEICRDVQSKTGRPAHFCGGECGPGTRQCDTDGKLQTCSAKGTWGDGVKCAVGVCTPDLGNSDASCQAQCIPGSLGCTGSDRIAADGTHVGTGQQWKCGSDGTWGDATNCAAGTACRVDGSGKALGCVECVGSNNEDGVDDSRCDPGAPAKRQTCGSDNKWDASAACGGATTCNGATQPSVCGTCLSANFATVTCTSTLIDDAATCGTCNVEGVGQVTCSETAIAASGGTGTLTCVGQGYGAPSRWGQTLDCCSGGTHRQGTVHTCNDVIPGSVPISVGATPDCCSHAAEQSGSLTNYAYCQ